MDEECSLNLLLKGKVIHLVQTELWFLLYRNKLCFWDAHFPFEAESCQILKKFRLYLSEKGVLTNKDQLANAVQGN